MGVGWNHPSTRMAYRKASHRSTRCEQSRKRQERSKERFIELAEAKDPNLKESIVHLDLQCVPNVQEILYMNKLLHWRKL